MIAVAGDFERVGFGGGGEGGEGGLVGEGD